jgi:hypothetical protein
VNKPSSIRFVDLRLQQSVDRALDLHDADGGGLLVQKRSLPF